MKNKFDPNQAPQPYRPLRKIAVIWNGFWYVMRNDFSVTYKVVLSAVIVGFALWKRHDVQVVLVIMATGFMLALEMMNSCVELLCDYLQTGFDEKIGIIKDVAATATGVAIAVWIAVVGFELWNLLH